MCLGVDKGYCLIPVDDSFLFLFYFCIRFVSVLLITLLKKRVFLTDIYRAIYIYSLAPFFYGVARKISFFFLEILNFFYCLTPTCPTED